MSVEGLYGLLLVQSDPILGGSAQCFSEREGEVENGGITKGFRRFRNIIISGEQQVFRAIHLHHVLELAWGKSGLLFEYGPQSGIAGSE